MMSGLKMKNWLIQQKRIKKYLLQGDENQVKEGKGLKIFTPDKLSTRLPILLAQIKAWNNSNKVRNEIWQIVYLLYQHNKISMKPYSNLIK